VFVAYSDLTHPLIHELLVSHSHFVVQCTRIIPERIRLWEVCPGFLATLPNGVRLVPLINFPIFIHFRTIKEILVLNSDRTIQDDSKSCREDLGSQFGAEIVTEIVKE
jgi:hypothetical protein